MMRRLRAAELLFLGQTVSRRKWLHAIRGKDFAPCTMNQLRIYTFIYHNNHIGRVRFVEAGVSGLPVSATTCTITKTTAILQTQRNPRLPKSRQTLASTESSSFREFWRNFEEYVLPVILCEGERGKNKKKKT